MKLDLTKKVRTLSGREVTFSKRKGDILLFKRQTEGNNTVTYAVDEGGKDLVTGEIKLRNHHIVKPGSGSNLASLKVGDEVFS